MLPHEIGDEIAKRSLAEAAGAGLKSAHYPAPGTLPSLPALVILWDGFNVTESNEQFLMLTYRGLLFTSLTAVESEIVAVDQLVVPIIDAFSGNLNRENYTLNGGVGYCRVERGELSVPITYNGSDHYGGRLYWGVKLRRFAGSD